MAASDELILARLYRTRIGEPTTHDEVRGYWVLLTGLVLATLGILLFLPSESAAGSSDFTLREASIFLTAVGLAMMVAGPVIRLPLEPWANYAAYLGQAVCFAAGVWFLLVFPGDWSVETGSQPVIVLYAAGIALITVVGLLAPLLVGTAREEEDAEATAAAGAERDRVAEEHAAETDALRERIEALHASQARFELYEDSAGQWRWRLRHRNGNVIADSGQGYTRKHNAQKGMASVRSNAVGAEVLLFEREADVPAEDEAFDPLEELQSQAAFEAYEDASGEHRFRLRHDNGNIIADGGEGYASRSNAVRAIDRVRETVGPADYLRFDPAAFEVYQDRAAQWRWRLVHRNGNILGDSGQGYTRRNDATRAAEGIRDGIDDYEVEVYEDAAGEYRWRLRSSNDRIVADSGEGYSDRSEAEDAVERVREYAPDAHVLDVGQATFEIYEDRGGDARWRLRHRNGNVLLDSGQGYSDRSGARDGIESVKRNAPNADLVS